jgi:uncharacterized protein YkwD
MQIGIILSIIVAGIVLINFYNFVGQPVISKIATSLPQVAKTLEPNPQTPLPGSTNATSNNTRIMNSQPLDISIKAHSIIKHVPITISPTIGKTRENNNELPPAPTLTGTSTSQTSINLEWTVPYNDGGSDITSYKIEIDDGFGFRPLETKTGANNTTTWVNSLIPDTKYVFRVSAINSVGIGLSSNTLSLKTGRPLEIPSLIMTRSPPFSKNQSTTQINIQGLYSFALKLVNEDRKANGLNPVMLSTIKSAQNHADDQMSLKYFSHWNSDGVKPYVTYTKLGGRGTVAENDYYTYYICPTANCVNNKYDPYEEITKGENKMMNNDDSSNRGHRDNILNPNHTFVNFGIAYDNERFYFVEHFEDYLVYWQIVKLVGNRLTMVGIIQTGYSMDGIDIFSDPKPKTLTEYELDNSPPYNARFYSQGSYVGTIVKEPTGNFYYPECSPGKINVTSSGNTYQCLDYATYENNSPNPNAINLVVDVSKWTNSDGLHTIYVNLKDSSGKVVPATSLTLEYLK